jgi:hypothetical protein
MAKHVVHIKVDSGTFSYRDENGNSASELFAGPNDSVEWFSDDGREFFIDFIDPGHNKSETPIGQRHIASSNGMTFAYDVNVQGTKAGYPYAYSVTMRDNSEADDPKIIVQNPGGPGTT